MNIWKIIQIGLYVMQKLQEFVTGGSASFSFDVSVKGTRYRVDSTVTKLPPDTPGARIF